MDKNSNRVDGIILAAGFGTRLRPLTDTVPKAAIDLGGKPLIYYALNNMKNVGVSRVVINTHYLSEVLVEKVREMSWPFEIIFSHEPEILGTGGGIQAALSYLPGVEAVLVQNADAFIEYDVAQFIRYHLAARPLSTMLLKTVPNPLEYGVVATDKKDRVRDINSQLSFAGEIVKQRIFCGMQALSSSIVSRMPKKKGPFCILKDVIVPAIKAGETVLGVENTKFFCDVGTPARLKTAERYLTERSRERTSFDGT